MEVDVKEWLKEKGKVFLRGIGIKEGQVVLDFGCNVGHYAIPAAEVVGKQGKVYAMDKDIGLLNELMHTAKTMNLKNIVPMHARSEELKIKLDDESVDVILVYDVLHYFNAIERNKIYNEFYRVLKKNGLLSVYPKHNKSDEPLWNLANMQLEDIIKEIESAKLSLEGKFYKKLIHDNYCNNGYILHFTKKDYDIIINANEKKYL